MSPAVRSTRSAVSSGTSATQLRKEFEFSVDDYLKVCEERGRTPDKPFSGKIPLRIPPSDCHVLAAAILGRANVLVAAGHRVLTI